MRLRPRGLAATTVLLLALPASAAATGHSPLHVDPRSPVAKAYALPLGSARATASPHGRPRLFGTGLHRAAGAPALAPPPGRSLRSRARRPTSQRPSAARPAARHRTAGTLRARSAPAAYRMLRSDSSAGWLWMVVALVAVVGLGAGGARALRRLRD